MKKNNRDSQKASELLRKLQEAVLSSSHKKDKQQQEPDRDELEFQKKIAGMLNRVTGQKTEPKKKSSKKSPKSLSKPTVSKKVEQKKVEIIPNAEVTVAEEPLSQPVPATVEQTKPVQEEQILQPEEPIQEEDVPTSVEISEPEEIQDITEISEEAEFTESEEIPEAAQSSEELQIALSEKEPEPIAVTEMEQETVSEDISISAEESESDASTDTHDAIPSSIRALTEEASPENVPSFSSENNNASEIEAAPAERKIPEALEILTTPSQEESPVPKEPETAPLQEPKKPLVRVIPAKPPAPKPKEKADDTIVIKPKSTIKSTVPIVIKPQKPSRTAEPIRVEVKTHMPQPSKKISPPTPVSVSENGKKSTGVALPKKISPPPPVGEREKSKSAETQIKRNPAGVSMPRNFQNKTSGGVKSKSVKKHAPRPAHAPDSSLSKEGFDIVLETVMQEELPAEPDHVDAISDHSASTGDKPVSRHRDSETSRSLSPEEALKYVEKKTGMTADDVSMIFELGYENELGRLVGQDIVKKLKAEHIRKARPTDKLRYRTAFGYRNSEYTGEQSRDLILANYVRDKKTLILRLALTALITLLLLPIEIPALFGGAFAEIRQAIPHLFPLLSLIGTIAVGIFSLKQLTAGLQSFCGFAPTPYSVAALLFPVAVISGFANLLLTGSGNEIISVNLPTVGTLLLTVICDAARLSSEMRVFRILSAEDEKTVLEPSEPHKQKLRHGDKIVKIINDDVDQNLYRLRRSSRISGFFRRCNDSTSAARPFGYLLLATLSLAFLAGFLCAVGGKDFFTVASAVLLTFFLTLPVPSILLFFYPLCRANRLLTHRNCALVGEESVVEYSQPKTVIFHDGDMYTAQKCTQTMVRDGEDFRRDMRLAGILFRKMSGALDAIGQATSQRRAADPPVTFVRLGENGTEAVVDNHYHLLAGDAQFLSKSGVRIPKESTDRAVKRGENVSLMYVAIDGVLRLTYEIEYAVSDDFERMISVLAEHSTYAAIRTYDPNLNDTFLQETRSEGAEYVRVIKPAKYEQDELSEVSDSGAVALGNRFDTTRPLIAASLIQKLRFYGYRVQFVLAVVGAILAGILSFNRSELLPGIPVFIALLFQCAAVAAVWIATRLTLHIGSAEHLK